MPKDIMPKDTQKMRKMNDPEFKSRNPDDYTYAFLLQNMKYGDIKKYFSKYKSGNSGNLGAQIPTATPQDKPLQQFNSIVQNNKRIATTAIGDLSGSSTVPGYTPTNSSAPKPTPTMDPSKPIFDPEMVDKISYKMLGAYGGYKPDMEAIAKIRADYERQKATYGKQAEQLAQSGLTNSGVSDNADRYAYAQKVSAEQTAIANQAALNAQLAAEKQAADEAKALEQKDMQTKYNMAYQSLVSGYTDDNGVTHTPLTHDQAVDQLKYAGYDDDNLIDNAKILYDSIKANDDKAIMDVRYRFAGTDDSHVSGESLIGRFMATKSHDDIANFINSATEITGTQYGDAFDAVDDLYSKGYISKRQMQYVYEQDTSYDFDNKYVDNIRKDLKKADGTILRDIASVYDDYKNGKISSEYWEDFKDDIADCFDIDVKNSGTRISVDLFGAKGNFTIGAIKARPVVAQLDKDRYNHIDKASKGRDIFVYDGKLCIRKDGAKNSAIDDLNRFVLIDTSKGTAKNSLIEILKIIYSD